MVQKEKHLSYLLKYVQFFIQNLQVDSCSVHRVWAVGGWLIIWRKLMRRTLNFHSASTRSHCKLTLVSLSRVCRLSSMTSFYSFQKWSAAAFTTLCTSAPKCVMVFKNYKRFMWQLTTNEICWNMTILTELNMRYLWNQLYTFYIRTLNKFHIRT